MMPPRLDYVRHRRKVPRRCAAAVMVLTLALDAAPAHAIVGPTVEGVAFADHMVMILRRGTRSTGICSGVVIAADTVLTAAHCVDAPGTLEVLLPADGGASSVVKADALAVHPGYRADAVESRKVSIDLALIHLAHALPARVQPVTLDRNGGAVIGTAVRLVGYGVTQEDAASAPGRLRLGMAAVRAPRSAVLLWAAAPDGTGACAGDSGGGIFAAGAPVLLAIIAWAEGAGSARCGALTQATWVAPHRAWIAATGERWAKSPAR